MDTVPMRVRKYLPYAILIIIGIITTGIASAQSGGGFDLSWWHIPAGSTQAQGNNFTLTGSIGQPSQGSSENAGFRITGGFWNNRIADTTQPVVLFINRASTNPSASANVDFSVVLSENVTGLDKDDFVVAMAGGVTGAGVSAVSGSGASFVVTVNTGTGSGTLGLDIPTGASVMDMAGNPLGGLPFTGQIYDIRKSLTYYSIGLSDGWILESIETSIKGGTLNSTETTFRLGDEAGDKQYRTILSFNTGALPDNAVITKVTLKIKKQGVVGTNPFTILGRLKVDIRKPYFGTFPGLQVTDFQAAANKVFVGTFTINPVNNWYSAVIGSIGYPYINKTGTTQFRLRFYKDDNDDDMGADYMKFYSGNYLYPASRPTLIIEYYIP